MSFDCIFLTIGTGFGEQVHQVGQIVRILWFGIERHAETLGSDIERFLLVGRDHLSVDFTLQKFEHRSDKKFSVV